MVLKPSLILEPSPFKRPVITSNTPLRMSAIPPITSDMVLKRVVQMPMIYSSTGARIPIKCSTIKVIVGPKTSFKALEKSDILPISFAIFFKAGVICSLIVELIALPIFSKTGWIWSFQPLTKAPTVSDINDELDSNKGLICSSYTWLTVSKISFIELAIACATGSTALKRPVNNSVIPD